MTEINARNSYNTDAMMCEPLAFFSSLSMLFSFKVLCNTGKILCQPGAVSKEVVTGLTGENRCDYDDLQRGMERQNLMNLRYTCTCVPRRGPPTRYCKLL